MNIVDATKEAMKSGDCIARPCMIEVGLKILPTNSVYGFIISRTDKRPSRGWQPKADDLTAEDWFVVD